MLLTLHEVLFANAVCSSAQHDERSVGKRKGTLYWEGKGKAVE